MGFLRDTFSRKPKAEGKLAIEWPDDTTTANHQEAEELVRRLAARHPRKPARDKHRRLLARALFLGASTSRLAALFDWPVLEEEFLRLLREEPCLAAAAALDPCYYCPPSYRHVVPALRAAVDLDAAVSAWRGDTAPPSSSSPPPPPPRRRRASSDVEAYAGAIVRAMERLYRPPELGGRVAWLRDPAVVPRVDRQAYMFYHVLLFKHLQYLAARRAEARRLRRVRLSVKRCVMW